MVQPASELVPGDIVAVRAGDMVPADVRLLEASLLEVDQASLTGESVPQSKSPDPVPDGAVSTWTDVLFAGTTVVSDQGVGVVVATGSRTQFGQTASHLRGMRAPGDFQNHLTQFGTFLFRFGVLLAIVVFGGTFCSAEDSCPPLRWLWRLRSGRCRRRCRQSRQQHLHLAQANSRAKSPGATAGGGRGPQCR